jgi:putative flippase GtrA
VRCLFRALSIDATRYLENEPHDRTQSPQRTQRMTVFLGGLRGLCVPRRRQLVGDVSKNVVSSRGQRRLTRFMTVGALGFAVQIAAFVILTAVAGWPWLPATIVAVELAVVHNFLWHDRWTWRDRSDLPRRTRRTRRVNPEGNRILPPVLRFLRGGICHFLEYARGRGDSRFARFVRFNMTTGLTSIAGNAAVAGVFVGIMRLPGTAGNVVAVGTMSVVNFVMSDRWVFPPRMNQQNRVNARSRRSKPHTQNERHTRNSLAARGAKDGCRLHR